MSKVADTHHLIRRNGVWYYHRRVPVHLAARIGRAVIRKTLMTTQKKEAVRLRALLDVRWDAMFADAEASTTTADPALVQPVRSLDHRKLVPLIQDYVATAFGRWSRDFVENGPADAAEKREIGQEIEIELQILQNAGDPRSDEWVSQVGDRLLRTAEAAIDDEELSYAAFAELVRRGLLELDRKKLALLSDDHCRTFFDQLFNPAQPPALTFGELADEFLLAKVEDAAINGTAQKSVDKQKTNLALIREIIGEQTAVASINYDTCLRVRSVLARVPTNRTKIFKDLPLDVAIERAAAEKRPTLAAVTQAQYLGSFKEVLDLAANKDLIKRNFAAGMTALKRDDIAPQDKRPPFDLDQLKAFFSGSYYKKCAAHAPPYALDQTGWRFWLPLLVLIMGLRPNEACQMNIADVRQTEKGTWYLDIVETTDEDDDDLVGSLKTLKTTTSRRKLPIHPEVLAAGFLQFVEGQKKAAKGPRLFSSIKPDKYGNHAAYPLKRFRDAFLKADMPMRERQSFYSFRHSFRDALRRIDAQPATLQALGAWSQGGLISDNYGEQSHPDFQRKFVEQIAFPGLDLTHLHVKS